MDTLQDLPQDFEHTFQPPAQPFRLLDLPTELWLSILGLAVARPYPIDPTWAKRKPKQARIVAQPAITRTCHLLRNEGLPLYYSLNVFASQHLHHVACTRDWLIAIGHQNRQAMRTLYFHCQFEPAFWVGQFEKCSIAVGIGRAAPDDEMVLDLQRHSRVGEAETLIITFV